MYIYDRQGAIASTLHLHGVLANDTTPYLTGPHKCATCRPYLCTWGLWSDWGRCMNWTRSAHVALKPRGAHIERTEGNSTYLVTYVFDTLWPEILQYHTIPCQAMPRQDHPQHTMWQESSTPQHILSSSNDSAPICGDALLVH